MAKLRRYIRYCGLTFEGIIFELKRVIFENSLDTQFSDDEEDDGPSAKPATTEAEDTLREQINN